MGDVARVDGCPREGGPHRGRADAPHPPGAGNIRATDCKRDEVNHYRGCYISVVASLRASQRHPLCPLVGIGGVIPASRGQAGRIPISLPPGNATGHPPRPVALSCQGRHARLRVRIHRWPPGMCYLE